MAYMTRLRSFRLNTFKFRVKFRVKFRPPGVTHPMHPHIRTILKRKVPGRITKIIEWTRITRIPAYILNAASRRRFLAMAAD
jgi:hypothetical protein